MSDITNLADANPGSDASPAPLATTAERAAIASWHDRISRIENILGALVTLSVPLAQDVGRIVATHGSISADTQLVSDALASLKGLFGGQ